MMTKKELVDIITLVQKQQHAHGYGAILNEQAGEIIAALIATEATDRQTDALNDIASALGELADGGVTVNVDVNTESFAEAIAEATANVTVTITDMLGITDALKATATGIGELNFTNTINIGETAKKLQATAKELERTAKKLEVAERSGN